MSTQLSDKVSIRFHRGRLPHSGAARKSRKQESFNPLSSRSSASQPGPSNDSGAISFNPLSSRSSASPGAISCRVQGGSFQSAFIAVVCLTVGKGSLYSDLLSFQSAFIAVVCLTKKMNASQEKGIVSIRFHRGRLPHTQEKRT